MSPAAAFVGRTPAAGGAHAAGERGAGAWRRLVVAACVGAALAFVAAPAARAQVALPKRCPAARSLVAGTVCSTVRVPLDRSGRVPGTIALNVQDVPTTALDKLNATPTPTPHRGTMLFIAGGPGQGAVGAYGNASPLVAYLRSGQLPGYDLLTFDERGSGDSQPLDCPSIQRTSIESDQTQNQLVAACARTLGARRDFYSTADAVADIDAVRQALGVDKIAIWAVSYGTKLALNYARAYPQHVERILLDSIVPADSGSAFGTNTLEVIPEKLRHWCAGGRCAAATDDFAGDVRALANAAEAQPLRTTLLTPSGRRARVALSGQEVLSTTLELDTNPGVGAAEPAAVAAARAGDAAPLARLARVLASAGAAPRLSDLSVGLYLATTCHDGLFPWRPDAPRARRPARVAHALAALPSADFGGLGRWAATTVGSAFGCLSWPAPAGGAVPVAGSYPNVPVLGISGGVDMRTPTEDARAVLRSFPQSHLVIDPGVGHNPTGADFASSCLSGAIGDWLKGIGTSETCPRPKPQLRVLAAVPPQPRSRLSAAATRAMALRTLRDAGTIAAVASDEGAGDGFQAAGLAGGRLTLRAGSVKLARYALVAGVTLSGSFTSGGAPARFTGTLIVRGRLAVAGKIKLAAT